MRRISRTPEAASSFRAGVKRAGPIPRPIALALAWLALAAGSARAQPALRVDGVALTVSDMESAVEFYSDVLSFEKVSEVEVAGTPYERVMGVFGARIRVADMRLGEERVRLMEYLAPRGRPIPVDSRSNDRWFQHIAIVVSDMDSAYGHLRRHQVEHASTGPQRLPDWNPDAGGIEAFYFKDPDGHVMELIEFPPGKGDPRWHEESDRLFLGIDHTAIVAWDTEASLAFYRDVLGLKLVGESENYGTEQEHLNNVFGARLRITTLAAPGGPGVELLEYLAPRDGRPFPLDTRANDLWHWHTHVTVPDVADVLVRLRVDDHRRVSPGVVRLPGGELGFEVAAMVRDPDGHAVLLVQRR